ncbi:MAG: acyltransferase [Gammaproteobacteria bacterium]|nr:acyltransferase [Gammaproteobacteria bacterium]MCH9763029.1 acyltransferase [Gammaproteobacteria bacterium]
MDSFKSPSSNTAYPIKYRAEIDGLRAIAVLSVILFHAGFEFFSGGFVGVDVFFVISGFLITNIILTEKQDGIFSILNFYERRARRILPALFFIMLVCLPFAWFWMLPDQLIDFSKSLGAVSTFISNIFFWRDTGYFSAASGEKPLLHTWSLGIEEQYYFLFPLLILLFWRTGKKNLPPLLTTTLILSLFISEYAVRYHPSASFFLIPTRAWEFLVGSLLAFIAFKNIIPHQYFSLKTNQTLSFIGLTLLIFPVFIFSEGTPFPGLYALVPVIGTALIIVFSYPGTFTSKLLSHRFIVGIGLISYSAYLWHQPLFAFTRIYWVDQPQQYVFFILTLLTLPLAFLTWKFVERPFRNKITFSRHQVFSLSSVGILFFTAVGVIGYYQHGFPGRLSAHQQALLAASANPERIFNQKRVCFLDPDQDKNAFGTCTLEKKGKGHILLWGDSHAAHLSSGLHAINQYQTLTQFTASGCPPIVDVDFNKALPKRPYCRNINTYIMEKIKKNPPDKVILAAQWGMRGDYWLQLQSTISQLQQLGIQDIIIVGPAPVWDDTLPHIMARFNAPFSELPKRLKSHLLEETYLLDEEMKNFAQQWKVNYLSLLSILCNHDGCLTKLGETPDQLMNFDNNHFTEPGSKYVISKLSEKLWLKPYQDTV